MKHIFKNKIVTVILLVLLTVCIVAGASFTFAKYVLKVDIGTFVLEIIGPPSEYMLTDGPTFNSKMAALLSETGNESVTEVVFGSLTDYKDMDNYADFKTAWQESDVYLDAEGDTGDGSIRAVVSGDTVYVLTFRNIPLSEKAMFANKDSSGMFKHNRVAAGEEYATGFIPEGRLTSITGLDKVDTSLVTNMSSMFMFCLNLTELNVTSFETKNVTDMSYMFRDCTELTTLDVSKFDTSNVEYMQEMFRHIKIVKTLDISNFDTSNVKNMQGLFHDSYALETITGLNSEKFDTSKVENMSWMFKGCNALTSIDVSKFDTSSVTDMQYMFNSCHKLETLTFGDNFDTSNVKNMSYMFEYCYVLKSIDLSGFDTSKVENMSWMFRDCKALTELDLSSFKTPMLTNMSGMFRNLLALTELDVSNFDTAKITDMSYLFWDLQNITVLDLSGFDTANVTNMSGMFGDCKSLTTIYVGDFWSTDKVTASAEMFWGAESSTRPHNLKGGAGTSWSSSHIDKEYARIDGGTASPGYLTYKVTLTTGSAFNSAIKDLFTTGVTKLRFDNYNAIAAEIAAGTLALTDLATLWESGTAVDVDEDGNGASDGNIRAFASGDTVYVLSKGYGVIFANEDCSNMFKHNLVSGNTTYASGFIPQGQLTAIAGLDKVNTSKVKNMSHMFEYCISLAALDVSSFDTSNVTDMSWMFRDCAALTTLDVSGLETTNVQNMQEMFRYVAKVATLDLSKFDTSNVTNMQGMFQDCDALTAITGLGTYSTAAVHNMSYMFKGCDKLSTLTFGDNFKTNAVTTMESMFQECSSLPSLNLSQFDTGEVTTMYAMFFRCSGLTSLTVPFDTQNVTDMAIMFHSCSKLTELDVSTFDTKQVKSIFEMFRGCSGLTELDVTNFDTSSVTDMRHTFRELNITTLDLSNFDTSNVDNMSNMFNACTKLKTIYVSAKGWSTVSLKWSESMFHACDVLVGGEGTAFANEKANAPTDNLDYRDGTIYACIDKAITAGTKGYLTDKNAPTAAQLVAGTDFNSAINGLFGEGVTKLQFGTYNDVVGTDTALAELWKNGTYVDVNKAGAIRVFTDETSGTVYVLSEGDRAIYANPDCSYMFAGTVNDANTTMRNYLTEIIGLDAINTSKVTSMEAMFRNCTSLTSLDVSGFDTSSVTSMRTMFSGCSYLTSLDLSGFDTGSVTTMQSMFYNCSKLTSLDDVSGFDTSSALNMALMFYGCSSLTSLDVSGFDTSNVSNIQSMFFNCSSLNSLDLSGFDTSGVTDMEAMFYNCSSLNSLDLSGFDTSGVTDMGFMFYGCSSLKTIYVSNSWTVENVSTSTDMFFGCTVLEGGEGTTYDSAVVDNTYACIDKAITAGTKGYLTDKNAPTAAQLVAGTTFNSAINGLFSESVTKLQFGTYNAVVGTDTTLADAYNASTTYVDVANAGTIRVFYSGDTVYVLSEGDRVIYANADCGNMFAGSIDSVDNNLKTYLVEIINLSAVNTSVVRDMNRMFNFCTGLTSMDVSKFDTSQVTTMTLMFSSCTSLTSLDVSKFDTSSALDISAMFQYCEKLSVIDVSHFDTVNVIAMDYMFNRCGSLQELDLSNFDTSNVLNMEYMFNRCSSLQKLDLSNFDTSNVSNMRYMFHNCINLQELDLSGFDTVNVENMAAMFAWCTSLTSLDLSNFNTAAVTEMKWMFQASSALQTIYVSDSWNTDKVTSSAGMFYECPALQGEEGTTVAQVMEIDSENNSYSVKYAVIDGGINSTTPGYLTDRWPRGVYTLKGGSQFNTPVKSLASGATKIQFGLWADYGEQNKFIWDDGKELGEVDGTIRAFANGDTVYILSIEGDMFANEWCYHYFDGMSSLTEINGLEYLDTSKVTNMERMFYNCNKLQKLDLSFFNTSNVTTMFGMFEQCNALTEVDISSFDTSRVWRMTQMFNGCKALTTVYVGDLWNTDPVTSSDNMFKDCTALKGGAGTGFNSGKLDKTYARIDDPANGKPGYFTAK